MTSVSLELQGAIVARLKGFAGLSAIVGSRIYDRVPVSFTFPYVTLGQDEENSDDAECITGFEVFIPINVWSQAVGMPEVKRAADQIRRALHDYDLPLTDNALVSLRHRQTAFRVDDGLATNARVEFIALVEQS